VNFKLFGLFGITFAFLVLQTLWLSRHMIDPEDPESGDE
jgi:intracellular septation protein